MHTLKGLILLLSILGIVNQNLISQVEYQAGMEKVQELVSKGNSTESYSLVTSLTENYPDSSQAWFTRSQVERKLLKFRMAYESISKALLIDNTNPANFYQISLICSDLQRFDLCVNYCDSVANIDSTNLFASILKAQALYKKGKHTEALEQYTLLHNTDSLNTSFIKQIGSINTKIDSLKEAIYWYSLATEIDSSDISSYTHLGNLFVKTEQYQEGLPVLSKAIEIDSLNSWLYRFRGSLNIMGAKFKDAEKDFESAISLGDSTAFTFRHLGLSLFKQSAYEEALTVYQNTIKLDPEDSQAWYYLGFCYKWKQDIDKAIQCMDKALEYSVSPSISDIYTGLAQFHGIERDFDKAKHYYSRAYEWNPDDAVPLAQMGMLVEQSGGKKEHAKTYYQSFLEKADPLENAGLIAYITTRMKAINEKLFLEGNLSNDK